MPTQGGLRKVVQFLPRIRSAAPPASSIFRSTTHHNPNPTCLWHPPTTATPPPLEVGSPAAQQAPAAQANCHCVLYLDSLVVSIFSKLRIRNRPSPNPHPNPNPTCLWHPPYQPLTVGWRRQRQHRGGDFFEVASAVEIISPQVGLQLQAKEGS